MVSIRAAKCGPGVRLLPWRCLLALSLQTPSVRWRVLWVAAILERAHRGPRSARLRGVPEVPLCLQSQPDFRAPSGQFLKEKRRLRADGTAAVNNGLEALERYVHPGRGFRLRYSEWLEKLFA